MSKSIRFRTIVGIAALATAAVAATPMAAHASVATTDTDVITAVGGCTWTVEGNIVVDQPTISGLADNDAVEGVKVKVSGRTGIGWFNEWDTDVTDSDGYFRVTKSECNDRAVMVEVQFEDDDLRVTGSGSKTWYEIYNSNSTMSTSTIDLNREPMGAGVGDQLLAQARSDAQTWIVYRTSMDYISSLGWSFTNKVTVHNPATLTQGVSAADPILQDIHIDPSQTSSLHTMTHELAHVYLYQHGTGEGCLTWNALISGDTHDPVESECVAYSEGTAETLADMLEIELNTTGLLPSGASASRVLPFDRARLSQTYGLDTLPQVGQRDYGWEQVNRVLFGSDITRWLFGTDTASPGNVATYNGAACSGQPVGQDDLADLLRVVDTDMDFSNVTVSSYLQRAADKLATMDDTDKDFYQQTINPNNTSEPHTLYGC